MPETTQTEGDDHDKPHTQRPVWQRPRLRRLNGADAENFEGPALDGPIVQS